MGEINIHASQPGEPQGSWSVDKKGNLTCNGTQYKITHENPSIYSRLSSIVGSVLGAQRKIATGDLEAVASYLNSKQVVPTEGSFGIKTVIQPMSSTCSTVL